MENANWIDCAKAKQMDLQAYLSDLGFEPVRIRNGSAWYRSPLREENTPSFKVNLSMNRWYDFALGKGGDLVEFGTRFFNCSVGDFLLRLNQGGSVTPAPKMAAKPVSEANQIIVNEVKPLTHPGLTGYLEERGIPFSLASQYLQQVHYTNGDRKYFAVGFANQAGGYELRNRYFKGASSPKDITLLKGGSKGVAVFEGFMDMLSYVQLKNQWRQPERDLLILNSLSFVDRALPVLQRYEHPALFLDNNKAAVASTQQIKAALPSAQSFNHLYSPHDDLNEYLTQNIRLNEGVPRHSRRQSL